MAKIALVFERIYVDKLGDIFTPHELTMLSGYLEAVKKIGDDYWYIMKEPNSITNMFLFINEMPSSARENIRKMHIIRYTDHATMALNSGEVITGGC